MNKILEVRHIGEYDIEVWKDLDVTSPRDDSTTDMYLRDPHYTDLPDDLQLRWEDFTSWDEVRDRILQDGALVALDVYVQEHVKGPSGAWTTGDMRLSLTQGGVSRRIGVAWLTPAQWRFYVSRHDWTGSAEQFEQARNRISDDVELYGRYLNGETYGITVVERGFEVYEEAGIIGRENLEMVIRGSGAR